MSNTPTYYSVDKCYNPLVKNNQGNNINPNFPSDGSLNDTLIQNFNIFKREQVNQCSEIAKRYEAPFFLVSNYEVSNNYQTINCYIPEPEKQDPFAIPSSEDSTSSSSTFNDVYKPFTDLINKLFLDPTNRQNLEVQIQDSSGYLRNSGFMDSNVCKKNLEDNYVYSASGNFVLYRNQILDRSVLDTLSTIKSYDFHLNKKNITNSNFDYNTFLALPSLNGESGGVFYNSFQNLVCDNISNINALNSKKSNFIEQVNKIVQYRTELMNNYDNLAEDLSKITLITNHSNAILDSLDDYINDIKLSLKNLLSSGGANNGRLGDLSYLNNLLIIENFIIFISLIIFIYVAIKKNNN